MARLPEDTEKILQPRINSRWLAWRDTDADKLWANPGGRTALWAFLTLMLFFALAALQRSDFGFARLLSAIAVLLPPLLFTVIVPPRGAPFVRTYLVGMGATALLMLLVVAFGWLAQFSHRSRALSLLWG